jgi:hypothetical protein
VIKVFVVALPSILAGFAVGFFVAEPLRGGLISALQGALTSPATVVALIAALLAFVSGVGGPIVTYLIGIRQAEAAKTSAEAAKTSSEAAANTAAAAGSRAFANVRLQWLQSVRETLAEYHSILMSAEDDDPNATEEAKAKALQKAEGDSRRISYLGTQLDLLLDTKKKLQKDLWKVSDDILKLETKKERQALDTRLVEAGRAVFEFQWRKIKCELQGEPSPKEEAAASDKPTPQPETAPA